MSKLAISAACFKLRAQKHASHTLIGCMHNHGTRTTSMNHNPSPGPPNKTLPGLAFGGTLGRSGSQLHECTATVARVTPATVQRRTGSDGRGGEASRTLRRSEATPLNAAIKTRTMAPRTSTPNHTGTPGLQRTGW
jgi:hypothetical protein